MRRQKAEGRITAKEVKKMRRFEDEKSKKILSSQLPNFPASQLSGFTLIEVIVAMAILGISLVLIMQLFAGGLRAARTSCDYSRAVVHAREKMAEKTEAPVQDSGVFDDGFKWETEVESYRELKDDDYKLIKIKVRIMWPDTMNNSKTLELVGLKAVGTQDEEEL